MTTKGRGDTLASSYNQIGQSESRYNDSRGDTSHFRSRPKNKYGVGVKNRDYDSSSDDNNIDINNR